MHFIASLIVFLCLEMKSNSREFLRLENRSESQVMGCYFKNNTFALCFDIQPRMRLVLRDVRNQSFVRYQKLPHHKFQANILRENFLWYVTILCSLLFCVMISFYFLVVYRTRYRCLRSAIQYSCLSNVNITKFDRSP